VILTQRLESAAICSDTSGRQLGVQPGEAPDSLPHRLAARLSVAASGRYRDPIQELREEFVEFPGESPGSTR
jgi:hypothetical protein